MQLCATAAKHAAHLFGSARGGVFLYAGWVDKGNSHDPRQRRYKRKFVLVGVSVLGTSDRMAWRGATGRRASGEQGAGAK